jgi:hypothetical protein
MGLLGLQTPAPNGAELLSPPRKRWEKSAYGNEPRRGDTAGADRFHTALLIMVQEIVK